MNPPTSAASDSTLDSPKAWRHAVTRPSLNEAYRTITVPAMGSTTGVKVRTLLAFTGPGYLVAVGYMDPGNWATDLAGGSAFGYELLSIIVIANFMAILLQSLSARLGIATGRDLAQACRDHYSPLVSRILWVLCELAICACDLAEILGTAIALNLLFNIPLVYGVALTILDVLLILYLQRHNYRHLEAMVISMIVITGLCFGYELFVAKPNPADLLQGIVPTLSVVTDPAKLYIAMGILGATVMPHNLYLHSSLVQTRNYDLSLLGKKHALRFATTDSTIALLFALFINGAILVLAASTFYVNGHKEVAEIQQAYELLTPLLGTSLAATLFAVALLTSGLNSSVTATLAGQIVMEGFLDIRLTPWLRRLITRAIAIIPAFIVTWLWNEKGVSQLLIFSQVILSLQLPFAMVPLLSLTGSKKKMGEFVMSPSLKIFAWCVAAIIIALNVYLLWGVVRSWLT